MNAHKCPIRNITIIALWEGGLSCEKIRDRMGISKNTASGVVKRAGLRRPPKEMKVPMIIPRKRQSVKVVLGASRKRSGGCVECGGTVQGGRSRCAECMCEEMKIGKRKWRRE